MPGGNAGYCVMRVYDDVFYEAVFVHQERLRAQRTRDHARRVINKMMMPEVNLLVRVAPQPWESLESFAYRAVDLNGLSSLSEVALALRWKPGRALSLERCRQLMNSLGEGYTQLEPMIPAEVDRKTVLLDGHRFQRGQLALTTSRLCPDCVEQYGYGKAYWSLAPLAVCEEHGIYLVDSCACNTNTLLSTTRPGYMQCACGANLRDQPRRRASSAAQNLALEIAQRYKTAIGTKQVGLQRNSSMLPPETTLSEILDLATFLGSVNPDYAKMNLDRTRPVVRLSHVSKRFELAAQALACWPTGVFPLLRFAYSHQREAPYSPRTAYRALQPVMLAAERWLSARMYKWFAEAVAAFIQTPSAWKARSNSLPVCECARGRG